MKKIIKVLFLVGFYSILMIHGYSHGFYNEGDAALQEAIEYQEENAYDDTDNKGQEINWRVVGNVIVLFFLIISSYNYSEEIKELEKRIGKLEKRIRELEAPKRKKEKEKQERIEFEKGCREAQRKAYKDDLNNQRYEDYGGYR